MFLIGFLKKIALGKLLKRVVFGVVDPVRGIIKTNLESTDNKAGAGKIDFVRLAASIMAILAFNHYLGGKINIEELTDLMKLIWKF